MIQERGDIHHIFPKAYIKKTFNSRKNCNQIANFVYTQSEINISIKDKPPFEYFEEVLKGIYKNIFGKEIKSGVK